MLPPIFLLIFIIFCGNISAVRGRLLRCLGCNDVYIIYKQMNLTVQDVHIRQLKAEGTFLSLHLQNRDLRLRSLILWF